MIGVINNYDKRMEILAKLLDGKLINYQTDLYDLDTLVFPISCKIPVDSIHSL